MLWEVDITPLPGHPDLDGHRVAGEAKDMGIADSLEVRSVRGYLVQGDIDRAEIDKLATSLFACLLYTSPSPRDLSTSRMPSSA